MKRMKAQQHTAEAENGKEPKWWKKVIVAPIFVGIILSLVGFGIWFMQRASEEKYGELLIASNVDSAKVFLNKELKGFTLLSKAVKIGSLKSGNYVLSVEKDGFVAFVDPSARIAAGEITSIKADLKIARAEEIGNSADKDTLKFSPPSPQPTETRKKYSISITVPDRFKNAKIMIDGDLVASAPNTISVKAGQRLLRIESDEFYYEEMLQVPGRDLVNIEETEFKRMK